MATNLQKQTTTKTNATLMFAQAQSDKKVSKTVVSSKDLKARNLNLLGLVSW
jgi:hypothetical protein